MYQSRYVILESLPLRNFFCIPKSNVIETSRASCLKAFTFSFHGEDLRWNSKKCSLFENFYVMMTFLSADGAKLRTIRYLS